MKSYAKKLCISAMCLALCVILPFITGQIQQIGNALCPMHIPVLLCGLICGWPWGLAVGFVSPLLRFVLFGMPPIFPTGISMAFELAAYGLISGILYNRLQKRPLSIYISLLTAMLAGRVVWGLARYIIAFLFNLEFTFALFLSGAFLTAIPGIICHILIIPPIVMAVDRKIIFFKKNLNETEL